MPRFARASSHARHGVAQIVVLNQRGAHQLLQLFVFEDLEPLEVGQRRLIPRQWVPAPESSAGTCTAGR